MVAAHVMSGSREQHEHIAFFSMVSTSSTGALLARVGRRLHRKTTEDSQTIHGSVMGESRLRHEYCSRDERLSRAI